MADAKSAAAAEYQYFQFYAQLLDQFRLNHPELLTSVTTLHSANPSSTINPSTLWTKNLINLVPFGQFPGSAGHFRGHFNGDQPKPQHSYIGLIAMAILSTPEQRMVLSDIYNYILEHYPYFRNRGGGWRNSIRHNLSLNPCFVKSSRSANGKGHYWAIHPANLQDFKRGDFCRRKAQRKADKQPCSRSGCAGSGSASASPNSTTSVSSSLTSSTSNNNKTTTVTLVNPNHDGHQNRNSPSSSSSSSSSLEVSSAPKKMKHESNNNNNNMINHDSSELLVNVHNNNSISESTSYSRKTSKNLVQQLGANKRNFDVESLLAPDTKAVA